MAGYRRRWNNRRYRSRRSFNKWAYNKTSAKNQAKQLVRLNKKVNRINRICRPVIYRYETDGYIGLIIMVMMVQYKNFQQY